MMISRALLLRAALVMLVLALWDIAPRWGSVDDEALPALGDDVSALIGLLENQEFITNALLTLGRVLIAFAIAAPPSIALGIFIGERLRLDRALTPLVNFALAIPQSIFLPVFILVLGIGFTQKVVFGATHVIFIVLINAIAAMRSVQSGYLLLARSFGATGAQIYWKFYLPGMLPYLMTGLRIGLILDVHAVLMSEMYASRDGLGRQIFVWTETLKTKEMFAAVILVAICTITVNELLRACELHLSRWRLFTAH